MDDAKNNLELLTKDNFLGLCDVMTDIYEDFQMTGCNKVFIQKAKVNNSIRFPQLRPTTSLADLDTYADYRIRGVQYLNKEGIIEKYMTVRGTSVWDKNIVITINEEKFRDFYKNVCDFYHQNYTDKTSQFTDFSEVDIKKVKKILDVINIKLSISGSPYILYIPFQHFPQDIQRFEIIGLLYKLDKDLNAFNFTQITDGQPFPEQQVCIRIADDKKNFITVKKTVDEKYQVIMQNNEPKEKEDTVVQSEQVQKVEIVNGSIKAEVKGLEKGLEAIAKTQKEENKPKFPHKLPAGIEWKNFTIQFQNKNEVYIEVNRFKEYVNYADMGFVDGRFNKSQSNVGWAFLWILAKYSGELTIKDPDAKDTYKKQKELVSKAFKSYFGMESDPFYPYHKNKSYKTRITLLPPPEETENKTHKMYPKETKQEDIDEEIKQFFEEQAPQVYDRSSEK